MLGSFLDPQIGAKKVPKGGGRRAVRVDMDGNEYGPMMAAATIIVAPLVVAFLLAQRKFIEGITLTGFK